jgi:hypothetical protein
MHGSTPYLMRNEKMTGEYINIGVIAQAFLVSR